MDNLSKKNADHIESISTDELESLIADNQDIQLLDVRSEAEYAGGHIEEAKNLPHDQMDSYQGAKDQPVYVICQAGKRSEMAAVDLDQAGYDVINVDGGMKSYSGPTVEGE